MRQKITLQEIADYLTNKEHITSKKYGSSPYGMDLSFLFGRKNLGRIGIVMHVNRPIVYSNIYGEFSPIKEDFELLSSIGTRYGVSVLKRENKTVYAVKTINSYDDIDKIYEFCVSIKKIRYDAENLTKSAEEQQAALSSGLEQLLLANA